MSAEMAREHAQSYAKGVREDVDAGHPFGVDEETGGPATAFDYLEGVLDIQYLVNSDATYRAGRVLVGFGGPNVWLDTIRGAVEVSWWSEPQSEPLPAAFLDGLDDALEELWSMR